MIHYKKGYKYQLAQDYRIRTEITLGAPISFDYLYLSMSGWLRIRAGYAWDGASGPTFDTKNSMRGSLVHDALYQLIRNGLLPGKGCQQAADDLLFEICREDGMSWLRAILWWKAVQGVGFLSTNEKAIKDLLSAGK